MHSTMVRKFGISSASEKFWFGENCPYVLYVCPSVYPSIHMSVHPHGCDHRAPTQSVCVADCYFIVNVLDLPFASPIAIYR